MNIDPTKFYTNEYLKEVDTWINRINEARNEAIKHGIQANTVLLSKRLAYLEATIEKFMPDGVEFIVMHKPKSSLDRIREDAQRELIERMKTMSFSEITELIYGEKT